jgi:histidinol dehydrogenase
MRIVKWTGKRTTGALDAFLRRPAFDRRAEAVAERVLDDIRRRGEPAIADAMCRFDRAALPPRNWAVPRSALAAARRELSARDRRAIREAHDRIARFAHASRPRSWDMPTPRSGRVGERFVPFDRVGVYVPGGQAPLVSTALMTVTLAAAAGVPEIVACTPCAPDGSVNAMLLAALNAAGATEVYRVGGVQAIGLMAYGTRRIRRVQKIVGPGGPFVTAAKRHVYGDVALDLVAGPSEIAVLADGSVPAAYAAADLLSQAEHGTGLEKALLVTPANDYARAVADAFEVQRRSLTRAAAIGRMAGRGVLAVVVPDLESGIALINRFAPEHLELLVARPRRWLRKVRCAGAVFLGPWTPESAGDFVAGPSHVLPTGGAAASFSGLTVGDFFRRTSVIDFARGDLAEALPVIEAFGDMERLDAHARSARIRFRES